MTTLIIPGLYGSGPGHWQHRWCSEIADAVLVEQADWARPDRGTWVDTLARAVADNPGALLVGHSLGVITIAHLAAEHPGLAIGGALLVAPADVETASPSVAGIAGFAPIPTRALPFPAIVVASRDDAWMRFAKARAYAGMWDAAFVDLGRAGHINAETGLGGWSQGRALLERLDRIANLHSGATTRRHGATSAMFRPASSTRA